MNEKYDSEKDELVCSFKQFCGEEKFRKFIKALHNNNQNRFRFWQQELWLNFSEFNEEVTDLSYEEIAEILHLCPVHEQRLEKTIVPALRLYEKYGEDESDLLRERFPFSNLFYTKIHRNDNRKESEIYVCHQCREELDKFNDERDTDIGTIDWQKRRLTTQENNENRERQYWPFESLYSKPQTELRDREVQLLNDAFARGYKPYIFKNLNYGFGCEESRSLEFIHRGSGRHWEIQLCGRGEIYCYNIAQLFGLPDYACICVDGYEQMMKVTNRWMQGASLMDVLGGYAIDGALKSVLIEEGACDLAKLLKCPGCEIILIIGYVTVSLIQKFKNDFGWVITRFDEVRKRSADAVLTGMVANVCPNCKSRIVVDEI